MEWQMASSAPRQSSPQRRLQYVWILVECPTPELKRLPATGQEINSLCLHLPVDPRTAEEATITQRLSKNGTGQTLQ